MCVFCFDGLGPQQMKSIVSTTTQAGWSVRSRISLKRIASSFARPRDLHRGCRRLTSAWRDSIPMLQSVLKTMKTPTAQASWSMTVRFGIRPTHGRWTPSTSWCWKTVWSSSWSSRVGTDGISTLTRRLATNGIWRITIVCQDGQHPVCRSRYDPGTTL